MRAELNKYVEKPWGYEKWIAVNEHYALKEIFLKKGERTSMQYHNLKEEDSYVLKGKLSIEEDNENKEIVTNIYEPGDIIHASPTYRHRVTALGRQYIHRSLYTTFR